MLTKQLLTLITISVCVNLSFAQTQVADSIKKTDTHPPFYFDGYADVYYATYSESNKAGTIATNGVVGPKNNSLGLNILQLSGNYNNDDVRGKITLQVGDIPTQIWPAEYRFVQEAYVGARIGKKTWLDAGFFKTHIGAEILPGRYNMLSTIAMVTYNEPFFQGGLRLVQETNSKFNWGIHLLDGFNKFTKNTAIPALGVNGTYSINGKLQLTYTNLLSDEVLNNNFNLRFYNNFNVAYANKKWQLLFGLDVVTQQTNAYDISLKNYADVVIGSLLTIKHQTFKKIAFIIRPEYFYDRHGMLSTPINAQYNPADINHVAPYFLLTNTGTEKPDGYKTTGITIGAELKLHSEHYVRIETRYLNNFTNQKTYDNSWGVFSGTKTNQRIELVITTGLWFDK
ncbi:MAG: outer membrane beta-barrel protein [Bacteroidia bacterium]|nr:outer membrane beta-barrel protein [Bacteroidia bacterium]